MEKNINNQKLSILLNEWKNKTHKILQEIAEYNKSLPENLNNSSCENSLSFKNYRAGIACTHLQNAHDSLYRALKQALVDELEEN